MVKPLLFVLCIAIISCSSNPEQVDVIVKQNAATEEKKPQITSPNFTTQVYLIDSLNSTSGFGYNILVDGAIFIHQNTIPSMPGNIAFSTKEKAELVANLMMTKLKNNIMPPSISKEELDSLHILN